MNIAQLIADFGFPIVAMVGLGYFVYFVWQTITNEIDPAVAEMKSTIIRLTDQLRLLDQDMIRLQQKVNVVLEYREKDKIQEEIEQKAEEIISKEKADKLFAEYSSLSGKNEYEDKKNN